MRTTNDEQLFNFRFLKYIKHVKLLIQTIFICSYNTSLCNKTQHKLERQVTESHYLLYCPAEKYDRDNMPGPVSMKIIVKTGSNSNFVIMSLH